MAVEVQAVVVQGVARKVCSLQTGNKVAQGRAYHGNSLLTVAAAGAVVGLGAPP